MEKAMMRSKASRQENMWAHFSPSCTQESKLQYLEAAQGRGEGEHAGKERDVEQQRAIKEILTTIHEYSHISPAWTWTVEQPQGSAMGAMQEVKEVLGEPILVHQCCYGYKHCKPTWIWTNLFPQWWRPRPFDTCQYCREGVRHPHRIVRRDASDDRPPPRLEGFTTEAAKNRIAPDLGEDLAAAMIRRWEAE